MDKQVKMVVEDLRPTTFHQHGADFKVVKLFNTTDYMIEQYLPAIAIDALIQDGTKVEIIKYKKDR